jgi:hypothetical protein
VALTPTAVERIAQAIHALRPQWPIASLETFLRDPKLANRPTRDVAIALTWIAVDPDTRTPARVHEDGPWWRAAVVDEAQTYRNPETSRSHSPAHTSPKPEPTPAPTGSSKDTEHAETANPHHPRLHQRRTLPNLRPSHQTRPATPTPRQPTNRRPQPKRQLHPHRRKPLRPRLLRTPRRPPLIHRLLNLVDARTPDGKPDKPDTCGPVSA